MNILFDTNIVLDVLLDRAPFSTPAIQLFACVERGRMIGFLGGTTITTVYYLAQKVVGTARAKEDIRKLLRLFEIASVNRIVLESAIDDNFTDFEDAVLYESAQHANLDAIVTRDVKGFEHADIPVYSPDELVKRMYAE